MSYLARGTIKLALASVRSTKWRSILTMFGVIVGIVSVVMVVGIGEGVKREVAQQMNQFGKDLITVRPGSENAGSRGWVGNADLLFGLGVSGSLSADDVAVVRGAQYVRLAAPLGIVPGVVKAGDRTITQSLVIATNGDLPAALQRTVAYGEFFDDKRTQGNTAVIGQSVAFALFNDPAPLAQKFEFRDRTFIVRGVFEDAKTAPLAPTADFNNAIFIPFTIAQDITGNTTQVYSILAKPDVLSHTEAAATAIEQRLLTAHGGERDFSVLDQKRSVAANNGLLDLLTTMVAAIAAISLLVGGVGVMNIMLASVTERTHEIGVRKAIGATNRQIMNQFVLEATVLTLVGGIIGIIISLVGVLLLRVYTDLKPVVSWQAIVAATTASLLVGIVFGVAPAVKAARKDPIEALRYE